MHKRETFKSNEHFILLALNFPDLHPIFRKASADCGDKVEIRPLFRRQNVPAFRKVLLAQE